MLSLATKLSSFPTPIHVKAKLAIEALQGKTIDRASWLTVQSELN
jgi:hypothetical protein